LKLLIWLLTASQGLAVKYFIYNVAKNTRAVFRHSNIFFNSMDQNCYERGNMQMGFSPERSPYFPPVSAACSRRKIETVAIGKDVL
jgi:hypothetical protein